MVKTLIFFLLCMAQAQAYELNSKLEGFVPLSQEIEIGLTDRDDFKQLSFESNPRNSLGIGYTNQTVWLKFSLKNNMSSMQRAVFYIDSSLAGTVTLYEMRHGSLMEIGKSGSEINYKQRHIPATVTAFQINLLSKSKQTFFLKRNGGHRLDGRAFLTTEEEFEKDQSLKDIIIFLYSGAVLALLIYNLFIGVYTRSKAYFYYAGYLFFVAGVAMNLIGGLDRIFNISISNYLMVFSAGSAACSLAFTKHFISPEKFSHWYGKVFKVIVLSSMAHLILYLIFRSSIGSSMGNTIDLTIMSAVVLMFYAGFLACKNKHPLAKFYLASWGVLLSSAVLWFGMTFGLFPQNILTKYALMWGNVLEMLILSLGLAYRIVLLDRQRIEAESLVESQKKYRMLLRVLVHDISNPVTVLNHFSGLVAAKIDQPTELKKLGQRVSRASKLISDIIKSVRLQEQSDQGHMIPVNLSDCMDNLKFIFQTRLEEKDLILNIDQSANQFVLADPSLLLNNVFSNLISNAIKFSPRGKSIDITIAEVGEQEISILIRDYGAGFSVDQLDSFDTEGRIRSQLGTEGESGTGYGMMVVKNFVDQFQGKIQLYNCSDYFQNSEKGALVRIVLKKTQSI